MNHKKCITKVDYAGDLDLFMPIYNLIECSSNYSGTTGGFIQKMKQIILMQIQLMITLLNLLNTERKPAPHSANGILKNCYVIKIFYTFLEITRSLFSLQLVLIMHMLILIALFLLSKKQNYMFLL